MMNRIAFIIGNATYPDSPLANPINDAQAIEEKLSRLNFDTIIRTDAKNIDMDVGLKEFSSELDSYEVAVFFFAGHGMQIEGKNYLTAIDTNFDSEIDAKHSSLPLDKVIEIMEKGSNQTDIIMLDACRTNPYERRWRGAESRGLAPVYAPKGMIVGYATSPGQVAYDGDGNNGSYTEAFLKHVITPDITIEDLFKRVRNTLSLSTRGSQISWEHTSLMGDFYFNYSFVSDELLVVYGENALQDSNYRPHTSDLTREIIEGLRSRNWPIQNSAMSKITRDNLEQFNKDDLFVLGRNIYQSACGTAKQAMDFIKYLQTHLNRLDDNVGVHVLNGMLFEIYFDSGGRFRDNLKSEEVNAVFQIESSDRYLDSFKFIRQALQPYLKNLFYIPLSDRNISVDVSCIDYEDDAKAVNGVFFEGDNVLYDRFGDSYFDPKTDHFLEQQSRSQVEAQLSRAMAVPSYRLTVSFSNLSDDVEEVLAPQRAMNIRRLSI